MLSSQLSNAPRCARDQSGKLLSGCSAILSQLCVFADVSIIAEAEQFVKPCRLSQDSEDNLSRQARVLIPCDDDSRWWINAAIRRRTMLSMPTPAASCACGVLAPACAIHCRRVSSYAGLTIWPMPPGSGLLGSHILLTDDPVGSPQRCCCHGQSCSFCNTATCCRASWSHQRLDNGYDRRWHCP